MPKSYINGDMFLQIQLLDAAIERGIADSEAGQVHDLDEVCDELIAELEARRDRSAE